MKDRLQHTAIPGEGHVRHHGGARFVRAKRAEVVGQGFRQHWYHPVGKIDRVPAPSRFAVQRRFRPDIVGDIGNRDHDAPATFAGRRGEDGIIEITCIGAIDGNERYVTKIAPAAHRRYFHALCLGDGIIGKDMGDVEFGKCQRAERPRRICRAQIVDNPCRFADIAAPWQQLGLDKVAFARGDVAVLFQPNGIAPAAVGLLKHKAAATRCDNAKKPPRRRIQNPDDAALVTRTGNPAKPCKDLLAGPRRAAATLVGQNADRGLHSVGFNRRHRQQAAIAIDLANDQHGNLGKLVGGGNTSSPLLGNTAIRSKGLQASAQRCTRFLRKAESARDFLY